MYVTFFSQDIMKERSKCYTKEDSMVSKLVFQNLTQHFYVYIFSLTKIDAVMLIHFRSNFKDCSDFHLPKKITRNNNGCQDDAVVYDGNMKLLIVVSTERLTTSWSWLEPARSTTTMICQLVRATFNSTAAEEETYRNGMVTSGV